MRRVARALAALAWLAWPGGALAQAQSGSVPIAFQSPPLSPAAIAAHVEALSAPSMGGRALGSAGGARAADYAARTLARAGLSPVGEGGMVQSFEIARARLTAPPILTLHPRPAARAASSPRSPAPPAAPAPAWRPGEDVVVIPASAAAQIRLDRAPLAFAGFGVIDRPLGWNQFAGLDLTGHVLVVFDGDPDDRTGDNRGFAGAAPSAPGALPAKIAAARAAGAAGLIVIHNEEVAAQSWAALRRAEGAPAPVAVTDQPFFLAHLSAEAGAALLNAAGLDPGQARASAERPDFAPAALPLGLSVAIDAAIETAAGANIVGVLRGATRPQEVVLFTAPWDGPGACGPAGALCPAALDDGASLAALLELARRFGSEGPHARSIAFAATSGGEAGLRRLFADPAFAPAQLVAVIPLSNIAAFGPTRDMRLLGPARSDLDLALRRALAGSGRRLAEQPEQHRPSPFEGAAHIAAASGAPSLAVAGGQDLFAGGLIRGRELWTERAANRATPADRFTSQMNFIGATQDLLVLRTLAAAWADGEEWPNFFPGAPYRRAPR